MQATISLKISPLLVSKLKKASKIRRISMSDLIRQKLEESYSDNSSQEPEILKYLGNHEVDDEIREFDKFLAESKKQFSTKQIKF